MNRPCNLSQVIIYNSLKSMFGKEQRGILLLPTFSRGLQTKSQGNLAQTQGFTKALSCKSDYVISY